MSGIGNSSAGNMILAILNDLYDVVRVQDLVTMNVTSNLQVDL
jgi:hypothetical protein